MFTGIIEECGTIKSIDLEKLTINCDLVIQDAKIGDSIAVNGVCLTVISLLDNGFTAQISPETKRISTLGNLKNNDCVNLERAVKLSDRLGGHIVSGHIDGLGEVVKIIQNSDFYDLEIKLNTSESKYVIKKGSITINGISLTIAEVNENIIKIAVIPHTYENTNLKTLKKGDFVNIEVDLVAKYIEKFLSTSDNKSRISLEFLQEHGF